MCTYVSIVAPVYTSDGQRGCFAVHTQTVWFRIRFRCTWLHMAPLPRPHPKSNPNFNNSGMFHSTFQSQEFGHFVQIEPDIRVLHEASPPWLYSLKSAFISTFLASLNARRRGGVGWGGCRGCWITDQNWVHIYGSLLCVCVWAVFVIIELQ